MEQDRVLAYERMGTEKLERLLELNAGMPRGAGLSNEEFAYICRLIASRSMEQTERRDM